MIKIKQITKIFFLLSIIILLTACANSEQPHLAIQNNSLPEIRTSNIEDGNIQINNKIINLPILVEDFLNNTELEFTTDYGNKYNKESNLQPNEEITTYMTSNNKNIITVYIKNPSEERMKKINNCYITGISISQTTDSKINEYQKDIIFTIGGIGYNELITTYEDLLKKQENDNFIQSEYENTIVNYYTKENYTLVIFYDKDTKNITEIYYATKTL